MLNCRTTLIEGASFPGGHVTKADLAAVESLTIMVLGGWNGDPLPA